jgi:hypothetical protein
MIEAIQNEQSEIHCSLCGSSELLVFYEVTNVPASCNFLWTSKEEAINCPKGNIKLAFCSFCIFITNYALEPEKNQYGHLYDNSLFYSQIKDCITSFAAKSTNTIEKYNSRVKQLLNKGKRVVMWGAGARGVTFLNILKDPRIEYAIDINPRKQGMYVPGTGQKIVEPRLLFDHQPDYIILANPAYENEIRQIISNLEIKTEFILI